MQWRAASRDPRGKFSVLLWMEIYVSWRHIGGGVGGWKGGKIQILIKASGSDKQEGNDLLFHLSMARVSKSKFQSREGTRQNLKEGNSQVAF